MKKTIIILLILLMLLSILSITGCGQRKLIDTAAAIEKQQLAIEYLSEDNFEQAILTFYAVLDIDSKMVEAYKGLAGAYIMQGEAEKAQEILLQGLAEVTAPSELNLALAGVLLDAVKLHRLSKY